MLGGLHHVYKLAAYQFCALPILNGDAGRTFCGNLKYDLHEPKGGQH